MPYGELTPKQADILKAMLDMGPGPHSPTQIGLLCGQNYCTASSWFCSAKARLIMGHYIIRKNGKYALTNAGADIAEELKAALGRP